MERVKIVRAADHRQWMVRQKIMWKDPSTDDEFEHDMEGGRVAAMAIVSLVGLLWFALGAWWLTGDNVEVPWWMKLLLVVVAAFFPVRWALRRPRSFVAETPGGADGSAPERWVGWVRGMQTARDEMTGIVHNLQTRATPASADSPLQPVS